MSDRDGAHMLAELQEARAEVDRLRMAIEKHRQAVAEYKGGFYGLMVLPSNKELWAVIAPRAEGDK
jgi:hypothetical protein